MVIEAHAPLRELFGYANAIRSLSQGRAGCSMEPLEYAPAPPDVAQAVRDVAAVGRSSVGGADGGCARRVRVGRKLAAS